MFIRLYALLSLALATSWSHAWSPGPATPAPQTNFTVNVTNRNDVISFYQNVFKASENYASVINWSGNHSTCTPGILPQAFVDLMQRRVNYYRAMAGVAANTTMNSASTVVSVGDPYGAPSTTTKAAAAQSSALLLSRTSTLTHTPSSGYNCFSTSGANGSYFGNIALGTYGPAALEAYMRENATNAAAGHRRWMLFTRATHFATGDIPDVSGYFPANSLYIRQRDDEMVPSQLSFVSWPPPGFLPWRNFTEYWSLSYPAADFSSATISVTKNGVAQPVTSINRSTGLGHNSIVWLMSGLPQSGPDVTYDVTVSNIGGSGVPTSHHYSFTFFNSENLLTPPSLSGSTTIPPGGSKTFTVTPVDIAEEYRLEVGKKATMPTTVIEGGEDATSAFIIPGPVTGYNLRPSTSGYFRSGSKSLSLAFTEPSQTEQWIELNRVLLPKTAATIKFYRRIGFLSSNSTFVAQYCLNHDGQWQDLPGTAKVGTTALSGTSNPTDSSFVEVNSTLPAATIGVPTSVRFLVRKEPSTEYVTPTSGTNYSGAFIDDISFTNTDWLSTRTLTNYPANATTVTLNATTAGETITTGTQYTLRLQPRVGPAWMTASSLSNVVVSSNEAPTLNAISGPLTLLEDATTQTIPLSGISAGLDEIQNITVTATSSNTALIPLPTVQYTSPNTTGSLLLTPALNQSGTATITVTVSDGQPTNGTISRTFVVNVTAVNDAPTISVITDRSINEDANTGSIAFTIGDAETAVGSLTVSKNSNNLTLVPINNIVLGGTTASRTVTVTPATNQFGTATISITVSDGSANTTIQFLLTVLPINDAPTLNTIPNPAAILEDAATQTINLSGISAGPSETQTLTISATSSNPSIVPHPTVQYTSPNATGSLQYAPVAHANGSVTITVTVNDGQASTNTVIRTFTVAVTAVNDAPTISLISNQSTNEDTATAAIAFTIGDRETSTTSLTLTRSSSNTTLVPLANAVLGGSGANRTITLTPAANQFGTTTIQINVSDGSLTTSLSFVLTVLSVNDTPTLSSISNPAAINEDSTERTVSLSGISAGPSNEIQTLSITATSSNTALIPHPSVTYTSPNATGSVRYTPVPHAFGTAVITVTVNDGGDINNSVSRTFTVTVNSVNDAPTISTIPAQMMVQNTTGPALPFTVGDLETAATSLTLTRSSTNTTLMPTSGIVFGGSGTNRTLTLTPATGHTGTATLTITVSDGSLTASSVFVLTVNAQNSAPTITSISPQTINEDTATAAIPFTIGDPEGAISSLSVSATSSNISLLPLSSITLAGTGTARTITLTPAAHQFGSTTVTITVNDGQSANATAVTAFTLQVNAVNDAPTISSIPNQFINRNASTGEISFTVGDLDNAPETLALSATSSNLALVPNHLISLSGSGSSRKISINPTANVTGQSTITITVSDGTVSQQSSFVLTVTPPQVVGFDAWVQDTYPQLAGSAFDDDYDNDGIPNGVEYAFSLDPTKPSKLGDLQLNHNAATMRLAMPLPTVRDNVIYGAEFSDVLGSWSSTGMVISIAGGQITATCPIGTQSRYIRWKITKN